MSRVRLVPLEPNGAPKINFGTLPPEAEEVCAATAALYRKRGFEPPWIGYFALRDEALVGACSFTSPPRAGEVEIAYFTFPQFEGVGIATAMSRALIEIAHAQNKKVRITANTLPQENASTAILRKLGFEFVGPKQHPEDGLVWSWRLPSDSASG